MGLTLVTAPTVEPVTTTEAKAHLRVDVSDDDALIGALIVAARQMAEVITRRALITSTWDYTLDGWPDGDTIVLPLPPLQSVTSVTYTDGAGVTTTFSASNYIVATRAEPGRIVLKASASWPSVTLREAEGVTVRFVAGYGLATAVPQAIKQAMLLMIGHWYENRELVVASGAVPKELPFTVQALLWPFRDFRF